MKGYRVTKYNPIYRNDKGSYIKDEWTDYSDIGQIFNQVKLTYNDYKQIEDKYINVVINLLEKYHEESVIFKIKPDNYTRSKKIKISKEDIIGLMQLILRNYIWGTIIAKNFKIYFGYDYYMYIGINEQNIEKLKNLIPEGLYLEKHELPSA